MGFQAIIGNFVHELVDYSVQESSTPLAAGDTSGQVGTISLTLAKPDLDVVGRDNIWRGYGAQMLQGREVKLSDSRKGFTVGRVTSVSEPSGGTIQLTCESRLGLLNVYNIQAQPFVGTLNNAFAYYCDLANVSGGVLVDPEIGDLQVTFPGFTGELWFNLKRMAAAIDADISLVSGVIVLRPIRVRTAATGRETDRSLSVSGTLAQSVEVVNYNNRSIEGEMVYPPGGWSESVPVFNVNAGEYVEEVIELNASVTSIVQPVMQTNVGPYFDSSSVFTAVGDDGLPVQPSAWRAYGGKFEVVINEDTTSLTVKITAPSGLPNVSGEAIGVFGIGLDSDFGTGRYSTLRIVGTGVAFEKETIHIPTGVSPSQTGTEVGATIDNPFIGSPEAAYRAGIRAAKLYTGRAQTLTASVVAINRLGESGNLETPPYSAVQAVFVGQTYADVISGYSGQSYRAVRRDLADSVSSDFSNQVFGNASGARYWDQPSHRWYRIRDASLTPGVIQLSADDDLTHEDVQGFLSGKSYGDVRAAYEGMTYAERDFAGLHIAAPLAPLPPDPNSTTYPSFSLYPSPDIYPSTL